MLVYERSACAGEGACKVLAAKSTNREAAVCMYVSMYACMCACMQSARSQKAQTERRLYVCMYVCVCACMCACMQSARSQKAQTEKHLYVCMHVCMYAHTYICITYTHVWLHACTWTLTSNKSPSGEPFLLFRFHVHVERGHTTRLYVCMWYVYMRMITSLAGEKNFSENRSGDSRSIGTLQDHGRSNTRLWTLR
jgi:hypothetical protein